MVRAEQKKDKELHKLLKSKSSLQLREINGLIYDISQGTARPYVPVSLRNQVFKLVHGLAHPGTKQTQGLLCRRFVWPGMKKEIKDRVRKCFHCQTAKVTRHNKSVIESIPNNVPKFGSVHIDIVGPLPVNKGKSIYRL